MILNEGATVTFTPHWGTSSHYAEYKHSGNDGELYIEAGDKVTVGDLETPQPKPDEKPEMQEEAKTQQTVTEEETEVQQDEADGETEEQ